jgi:MoxR-like ATPase
VIFDARKEVNAVATTEAIDRYLVGLVSATRNPGKYDKDLARWIHVGASPRGTLALDRASRANAWLQGRDHVTAEDVQAVAPDCLRHRIIPSYDASAEGKSNDDLLASVLKLVAVP